MDTNPICSASISKPLNIPDPANAGNNGANIAEIAENTLLIILSLLLSSELVSNDSPSPLTSSSIHRIV